VNEDSLPSSPVSIEMGDLFMDILPRYINQPVRLTQPGPSSMVHAVSTGDSFGQCWERNSEFCVTLGPVTGTAGIQY